LFFNSQPIRIISRPKLTGLGEHWGVQLPDGNVAHLTPEGEQIVSFTEFAQGRPIKEVRRAAPEQRAQIMQRLSLSLQHRIVRLLIDRVQLRADGLDIVWKDDGWHAFRRELERHPFVAEQRDAVSELNDKMEIA
jgi:hypothetical protein